MSGDTEAACACMMAIPDGLEDGAFSMGIDEILWKLFGDAVMPKWKKQNPSV